MITAKTEEPSGSSRAMNGNINGNIYMTEINFSHKILYENFEKFGFFDEDGRVV